MTIFENEEDDMHSTFEQVMNNHLDDETDSYLFHEVRTVPESDQSPENSERNQSDNGLISLLNPVKPLYHYWGPK